MPEGVKVSIGNVYFFIGEPGSQDYLARITSFDHRGTIETKYYYCTTGSEMNPNSTTFCYHYYTPRIPTYEEDQKFLKYEYEYTGVSKSSRQPSNDLEEELEELKDRTL